MDDLFSKALDVLEPLQTKAISAFDSTLGEYPKPSGGAAGAGGEASFSLAGDLPHDDLVAFSPSSLEAGRRLLAYWEEVDLESRKAGWDEQSVAISVNQETSAKNRKQLADTTRAFKSGDKKDVAPLLKSYQGEIDVLTKRAKHAETAYLGVYQLLYDAPEVVPPLRALLELAERTSSAEQEARRGRQEVEVLKREVQSAKSLHTSLRRLEERNAELESELESEVERAVAERMQGAARELEAAGRREAAQQALLEETREALANLQRQYDGAQSQLFDLKARSDEERAARQHEQEMASEEIEAALERVRGLEAARQALIAEVEQLTAGAAGEASENGNGTGEAREEGSPLACEAPSPFGEPALERSLELKEKLVRTLHVQLQQLEAASKAEQERQALLIEELEARLGEQEAQAEELQQQLAARPTPEQLAELQQQVTVLQELVGSDVAPEWEEPRANGDAPLSAELRGQRVLQAANRRAAAELTTTKRALRELEAAHEELARQKQAGEERAAQREHLVARLEEDIAKMGTRPASSSGRDGWKDASVAAALASQLLPGLSSGSSSSSSRGAEDPGALPPGEGGPNGERSEEGALLAIVCGQRERFRLRVKELEEENGALGLTIGKLSTDVERLRVDNVSLYEKIKFLEQYNRQNAPMRRVGGGGGPSGEATVLTIGGAGARGARYACFGIGDSDGPGAGALTGLEGGGGSAALDGAGAASGAEVRYRKIYEERMNPFTEFHAKEQERSYRNLRLHDKITLTGGRFLLSNKYGRMFVFFYTILLHFFIFFVLYRSSSVRPVVINSGLSAVDGGGAASQAAGLPSAFTAAGAT